MPCGIVRSTDGFLTLESYSGFGEQVKATKRKLLSLPDRCQATRQEGRRATARPERQYLAQLLWYSHRLPGLHSGCQPVQARQAHTWHPDSDPSTRGHPRSAPRLRLILPWNLQDEISRTAAYIARMGRALRRTDTGGQSPITWHARVIKAPRPASNIQCTSDW